MQTEVTQSYITVIKKYSNGQVNYNSLSRYKQTHVHKTSYTLHVYVNYML